MRCLAVAILTMAWAPATLVDREAQPPFAVFEGEWRPEAATRGITRLRVSGEGTIHAWGACHPQDCDWGERPLILATTGPCSTDVQRGFATWDTSFATKHVVVRMGRRTLVAETYTLFKDRSGRSNYFSVERLVRKSAE